MNNEFAILKINFSEELIHGIASSPLLCGSR